MRQILLIGLICLVYCLGFSQEEDSTFSICGDNSDYKFIYAIGGVFFYPATDADNLPDSVLNHCSIKHRVFSLNGAKLTERHFTSLELKPKYIVGGQGDYMFEYAENQCVETIVMSVKVNLPIFLNGEKLAIENQKEILRKIKPLDILSVERKESLFSRGKIYIETKP